MIITNKISNHIFPNSTQQICTWHKSQNFKKHFLAITKTRKINELETNLKEEKEKRLKIYNILINLPFCRRKYCKTI